MRRQHNGKLQPWGIAGICLLLMAGCGGALRTAVLEHADASRAVALTLARAATELHCAESKDEAASRCQASVGVIETQVQVLRDSAERLQRAAR